MDARIMTARIASVPNASTRIAGLLAAIFLFLGGATLPAAAQVPPGSYLYSCRDAQVRFGRDLAAFCPDAAGAWVVTRLNDFPSCRSEIVNRSGQLWCDRPNPEPPPAQSAAGPSTEQVMREIVGTPAPPGSYRQSCERIAFENGVLTAACRTPYGDRRVSSLRAASCGPGTDIANLDGILACQAGGAGSYGSYGERPPPGSYVATCRDIRVDGGWLMATCQDRWGNWRQTSTTLMGCRAGADIINDNGTIDCRAASSAFPEGRPPYGSYLATCRNARVGGGWLSAECQDRWGSWRPATMTVSSCERGADIVNDNGSLTCRRPFSGGETAPPRGSYMMSCKDIRVTAGWLKASCRDRNGRWMDATTAVGWCSAGRDIANDDGRLTCR